MNLPICQTVRGLCTGTPASKIATAQNGVLDYQVGQTHTISVTGDSIFVNPNMLHGIRQVSGMQLIHLPIIIFSGTVIASENSVIYQTSSRFLRVTLCPVLCSDDNGLWKDVRQRINATYRAMRDPVRLL